MSRLGEIRGFREACKFVAASVFVVNLEQICSLRSARVIGERGCKPAARRGRVEESHFGKPIGRGAEKLLWSWRFGMEERERGRQHRACVVLSPDSLQSLFLPATQSCSHIGPSQDINKEPGQKSILRKEEKRTNRQYKPPDSVVAFSWTPKRSIATSTTPVERRTLYTGDEMNRGPVNNSPFGRPSLRACRHCTPHATRELEFLAGQRDQILSATARE